MNYHAIIGTKQNMQGEKSTCLHCQTAISLPRILVLDFPRTACCLHDHTSKANKTNKEQYKNGVNRAEKAEKDVDHDVWIG